MKDDTEGRAARNTVLPSTGNSKSYIEFVEDEISLVPTSVSTFYSPLTEVSKGIDSGSRNPAPTIDIDGWGEDWIKLVTPYVDLEGKPKCPYCGVTSRSLESHIQLNHRERKKYLLGFSGEILMNGSPTLKKAHESDLASRRTLRASRRTRL